MPSTAVAYHETGLERGFCERVLAMAYQTPRVDWSLQEACSLEITAGEEDVLSAEGAEAEVVALVVQAFVDCGPETVAGVVLCVVEE
jgi:hypothetical protein